MAVSDLETSFPPVDIAIEMEPEELAPFILRHLNERGGHISRYNFTLGTSPDVVTWAGARREEALQSLMVAWVWLERELFLAPKPGSGDWSFVTARGKKVLEEDGFDAYKKRHLLPSDGLDPILVRKVKPEFIRGDYETAVFKAFKEVEVRVRKKSGLTNSDIGTKLMREAFKLDGGILTDPAMDRGEATARMELFAGAIGTYKNPSGHRDVELTDPQEAAEIIGLANQLLRILGSIASKETSATV